MLAESSFSHCLSLASSHPLDFQLALLLVQGTLLGVVLSQGLLQLFLLGLLFEPLLLFNLTLLFRILLLPSSRLLHLAL